MSGITTIIVCSTYAGTSSCYAGCTAGTNSKNEAGSIGAD